MIGRHTLFNILLSPILAASTAWSGVPDGRATCCRHGGVPSRIASFQQTSETARTEACCCRGGSDVKRACACRSTKLPAAPSESAASGRWACDWFMAFVAVELPVAEIVNVRISHSCDRLAGIGMSSCPVHAQLCNWRI